MQTTASSNGMYFFISQYYTIIIGFKLILDRTSDQQQFELN